jgi:hypothetical protein
MGCFFQGFTGTALSRRLTRVQMTGRVVQAQALWGVFFDQQVSALFFNDGGDRDIGFPACVHVVIINALARKTLTSVKLEDWLFFVD